MIFLILLISFIFTRPAIASPEISIQNYPTNVIVGDTFAVDFNVTSIDIGLTYHYKAVGDSNTDISIFPPCASRYDDCLNIILSDLATNSATAYLKINLVSPQNFIKIRLALADKHSNTYDSNYVSIASFLPSITPTITPTPESSPSAFPTISAPTPSINLNDYLSLNEIMSNPNSGEDEWIEIKNSSSSALLIDKLCFYDAANNSRCLSENTNIGASSFFIHSFSSGFLNNSGDTIYFLNSNVSYPKSPQNYSYSLQKNGDWCFANPSQNFSNNDCLFSVDDSTNDSDSSFPALFLDSSVPKVSPGQKFSLNFKISTSDPYLLRLNSPFGNHYLAFSNFHDNYSWLTMDLSVPKTLSPGNYPLEFHLKKEGTNRLFDFSPANLTVIENPQPVKSKSRGKVLGVSSLALSPTPTPITYCLPTSTLTKVLPNTPFFSWPFLFVGSILFLSPILFPKLYSVSFLR